MGKFANTLCAGIKTHGGLFEPSRRLLERCLHIIEVAGLQSLAAACTDTHLPLGQNDEPVQICW
jgi:aspartate/glutamate racemase